MEGIAVYKAIVAVQADLAIEGIAKDRTCTQGATYKFRGIDDIYNALAPFLAKHNLCVMPRFVSREQVERVSKNGGAVFYTTVEAEFDFVSAEDGSKHTVKTFGEAMDSGDKGSNKAMSAAYKYAAFQTFCIPTEGDNDTENSTHEIQPKHQQQRQQAAKSASQPANVDPTDAEYHERIKAALKAIYGDDKQSALDKVEDLTTFTPKGKTEAVNGVRNYLTLKGDRAKYLAQNLEKLVPKGGDTCPSCGAESVNGVCQNSTCTTNEIPF